jgi:threonine/homoserine/homoserine lactone efflux protein
VDNLISLFTPFLLYFFGIISPGPANIAIMQTSLEEGRGKAIIFTLGVFTVSISWGLLVAFGIEQVIIKYPQLLKTIGLFGAIYITWLGYKSFKKAIFVKGNLNIINHSYSKAKWKRTYIKGVLTHIGNPKAIMVWSTIMVAALDSEQKFNIPPYLILMVCWTIGVFVFFGYALVFSNYKIIAIYNKRHRFINFIIGMAFILISIKLIIPFF